MTSGSWVIRADASPSIGSGHIMRCLALAQAWQDQVGGVRFIMAQAALPLETRLRSEGMEVSRLAAVSGSLEDARQTVQLAQQCRASWIVVDGYQFGAEYQRLIKDAGQRLLAIDDHGHADHYYADIILNQNLNAHKNFYRKRESYAHLLLGTEYVLLRREFLKWHLWQRDIPEVARKILVTMGGGDPANVTLKVLKAIKGVRIPGLEVVAVIGAVNPHFQELKAEIENAEIPMSLENNLTDMPKLMAWADVAVSAGGSTCWELAYMGLSTCIIILAANQVMVSETLQERGLAANAGWFDAVHQNTLSIILEDLIKNKEKRLKMGREGRNLVTGQGSQAVIAFLKTL